MYIAGIYHVVAEVSYFLFIEVRALCCQQSRDVPFQPHDHR